MDKRRSPRILPGPSNADFTIRPIGDHPEIKAVLLNESVDGIAAQVGRHATLKVNQQVEVFAGTNWESATVTSVSQRGIVQRIGLKWGAEYQEPPVTGLLAP
jgi:hypothetical protein